MQIESPPLIRAPMSSALSDVFFNTFRGFRSASAGRLSVLDTIGFFPDLRSPPFRDLRGKGHLRAAPRLRLKRETGNGSDISSGRLR